MDAVTAPAAALFAADLMTRTSTGEAVQFWILGTVAVLGALGVVCAPKAVYSAIFLAMTMIVLAVLYIAQGALFLGVVQVVVYTGAVMMLFLFVLMLVGVDSSDSLVETLRGQRIAAVVVGIGFGLLLIGGLGNATVGIARSGEVGFVGLDQANAAAGGNVQGIASIMFTRYIFAFEVTSALLITAATGALMLAHIERRRDQKATQPDRMRARFAPGSYPGPKAGPGVYATSDSVATPARLPDGRQAERSVPQILPRRELTEIEAAPKGTDGR